MNKSNACMDNKRANRLNAFYNNHDRASRYSEKGIYEKLCSKARSHGKVEWSNSEKDHFCEYKKEPTSTAPKKLFS